MASQLIEIVTAEAVPAGGTVVIPHHINVDGNAKIPDWISRDNMGFAGISCDDENVTVRNDTDAAADIELYLFYDHTIQRVYGDKAVLQLSPAPFWIGGSASSIVPDSIIDEFVYQPGGAAAGPSVFASFPALYTAMVAARTAAGGKIPITLGFDSSLGAVTIPAGTYDFTNVLQVGVNSGGGRVAVSYADGTVFTGARRWRNLTVTNLNTTTSPISDMVTGDQFFLENTVVQTTTGVTIAFFRSTLGGGQNVTFWLIEGSTLGGSETGRVIVVSNGTNQTRIKLDALSSIAVPSAISNGGFATPTLVITAPAMIQIPTALSGWTPTTGWTTPGPTLTGPASLRPTPFLGSPQTGNFLSPEHGQWIRLNAGSVNIAQELPAISSVSNGAAGTFLLVTDSGTPGTTQATITPAAGDTIEGSSSARGVPRSGGILLVSDGVSRWSVVAAWGLNRMLLPYIWRQDNVPAGQTDVAISPTGTLFANFLAMRPGSVVGITARFNTNVTVAGATFTVTKNGVATTLVVSVLDGSSSGTLTALTGESALNNYIAGDLIGVTITTTGGFAPTTADVEVYVEVEECP